MGFVNFAEYRNVNSARITVNNAMIALLAGSRLASHTLTLTAGSDQLLPRIFPQVPNIQRFNLRTDGAKTLLDEADEHVAAVSVPYALSVHEDFVIVTLGMIRRYGTRVVVPGKRKLGPATMHETLFDSVGQPRPTTTLELFHVLREMRNSQIHEGGRANSRLVASLANLSGSGRKLWEQIVVDSPSDTVQGGRVVFSLGHMFLVFAVIKRLARDVNVALQSHWSRAQWAEILVRDFSEQTLNLKNSSSWRRSVVGYSRFEFGPLGLMPDEIETAARTSGHWTGPSWA